MATLKSLVDETSNIKDELVECHTNLKNNLIVKGVECSDNDKMSNLIDKIEDIPISTTLIASENPIFSDYNVQRTVSTGTKRLEIFSYRSTFIGSVRFSMTVSSPSVDLNCDFCIYRGGALISSKTTTLRGGSASYDFSSIKVGDTLKVITYAAANGYTYSWHSVYLKGAIV